MLRIKNLYLEAQEITRYVRINQFKRSINNFDKKRASNI